MTDQEIRDKIAAGREFLHARMDANNGFVSDQTKKLPQPPLTKAPMTNETIRLPRDFDSMEFKTYFDVVTQRQSRRIYSMETMALKDLSFMLYAAQGINSIRGNNYATLRTVPSGGARHAFELYFLAQNVEGLKDGAYHYLPLEHEIEYLHPVENIDEVIAASMMGQGWCAKANVAFYLSFVPYRAEWRYGINAHRVVLIDAGHVGQALYLAAEALGLGSCGVAAFNQATCDGLFGLDGNEEYVVYTQTAGCFKSDDRSREDDVYAFVKNENGAKLK